MKSRFDLIVYHGDCPDGWCAAYIAKKLYPEADLFPATHGGVLPDVDGRNVLVVDFSWKRDTMEFLAERASSILVLDHHHSAEKELDGLPYCHFDMTRSGAGLTWDTLASDFDMYRPWWVNYVEDRDLWNWALPRSREVSAYVMAQPMTIPAWDALTSMSYKEAADKGLGILAHIEHYVEKVAAQKQMGTWRYNETKFDGRPGATHVMSVAVVNAAYPNISDVCNRLCAEGAHIGMGWFHRGDGLVQFSLRSQGDLDVSVIAKSFGGGGHKNAAGFQLPMDEALALLRVILKVA